MAKQLFPQVTFIFLRQSALLWENHEDLAHIKVQRVSLFLPLLLDFHVTYTMAPTWSFNLT